jgi:hypothetical protein
MANIGLRTIISLLGENFFIPSYQRGYRWTDRNVRDLLNDVWTFAKRGEGKFYCLQPIVVQASEKGQNVIDGQQRLTSIYIILKYLLKEYLKLESLAEEYGRDLFTITYSSRPGSQSFLSAIDEYSGKEPCKDYIDYYYMSNAYKVVKKWFTDRENIKDRSDRELFLRTLLGKAEDERSVQVIWYEAEPEEDGVALFTRLNVGKIPLTNAELIKALFLSSRAFNESDDADIKKKEISLIWDKMESDLSDVDFWAFATNEKPKDSNRIELILDAYLGKKSGTDDPLYTFIEFSRRLEDISKQPGNKDSLWDTWLNIELFYETLSYWYTDKLLYHRVGFLISCGYKLYDLLNKAVQMKKDEFLNALDKMVSEQLAFTTNTFSLAELKYNNDREYELIKRILLLFNIETMLKIPDQMERYPFRLHKEKEWSLEHIHAQNSEELRSEHEWRDWLNYHKLYIKKIAEDPTAQEHQRALDLYEAVSNVLNETTVTKEAFNSVAVGVTALFSAKLDADSLHRISNLALLGKDDNAALNNAIFAVKRQRIINMDKRGEYIPICTRRAFFKYYSPDEEGNAIYFWSNTDMDQYEKTIRTTLARFLPMEVL